MSLTWIRESIPTWDADKARVLCASPQVLDPTWIGARLLPGAWWRIELEGEVVAYAWLDAVWGDGRAGVVVDPLHRGQGIGRELLEGVCAEATRAGLAYVSLGAPDADGLVAWLATRGFKPDGKGHFVVRTRALARCA